MFRELLIDGKNALLVNPEDSEELGKSILHLVENSQVRKNFAEAVVAMNFGPASWAQIAQQTLDVYGKLLLHIPVL